MPRTIVDIPAEQLQELDRLREQRHQSRANLIRDAITGYLAEQQADLPEEAFGIWRGRGIDGVEYTRRLRAEWDS